MLFSCSWNITSSQRSPTYQSSCATHEQLASPFPTSFLITVYPLLCQICSVLLILRCTLFSYLTSLNSEYSLINDILQIYLTILLSFQRHKSNCVYHNLWHLTFNENILLVFEMSYTLCMFYFPNVYKIIFLYYCSSNH